MKGIYTYIYMIRRCGPPPPPQGHDDPPAPPLWCGVGWFCAAAVTTWTQMNPSNTHFDKNEQTITQTNKKSRTHTISSHFWGHMASKLDPKL